MGSGQMSLFDALVELMPHDRERAEAIWKSANPQNHARYQWLNAVRQHVFMERTLMTRSVRHFKTCKIEALTAGYRHCGRSIAHPDEILCPACREWYTEHYGYKVARGCFNA